MLVISCIPISVIPNSFKSLYLKEYKDSSMKNDYRNTRTFIIIISTETREANNSLDNESRLQHYQKDNVTH